MRRIFLIIVFVVVIVGISAFLWLAFFKPPSLPVVQPPLTPAAPQTGLPQSGPSTLIPTTPSAPGVPSSGFPTGTPLPGTPTTSGRIQVQAIIALTSSPTVSPTISASGDAIIYWNSTDSRFYIVSSAGAAQALSPKEFFSIESAMFSSDRANALISYPDGAKIVYNFKIGTQYTLPSFWKDFSFSPDGASLVFKSIGRDIESRVLATASLDGSNFQDLTTLGDNESHAYPLWSPQGGIVALYTEASGLERQNLFFVGEHNEQFQSIPIPGLGFKAMWTNRSGRLIFQTYSGDTSYRPDLWIVDASVGSLGTNRRDLHVETFLDTCALSADDRTLFCAIPRDLPEGAGLTPQIAETLSSDFWKIDLETGLKTLLLAPRDPVNVETVLVSSDEKYLFFKNRADGRLYEIKL